MDSPEVVNHHQQQQIKYEPYSPQSSYAHTGTSSTPIPVPYTDQAGLEVAPHQPRPYQYGPATGEHRTICGIARSTFILAIILAVVIVAAAVGGGVGGSVAVSNAKSACNSSNSTGTGASTIIATTTVTETVTAASTTGTGTSTSASAFSAPTNVLLALDCPNIDGSNQVINLGDDTWTFEAKCGYDFNGDIDILAVTTYTFRDCMKACASYNRNRGSNDCLAVEFSADMKNIVPNNFGTCFLKTGTGKQNNYGRNTNVGATLVSS